MTEIATSADTTEIAASNGAGLTRQRRILRGDGMVTPRRMVEVTRADGRIEKLHPERSRLVPTHSWVRENPEAFTPVFSGDFDCRAVLERLRSGVSRGRPRGTGEPWLLPASGQSTGSWRLR